ncbi:hypothetical protein [Streptomyces olivoreticuli]|uniref:hypothetical protein n=1 Tax=Streptomyces olivoreticuli TaxID=68246 RepID=UPI0013C35DF3|nr:hypothetical protein [Streptomyces olivoreticuli]
MAALLLGDGQHFVQSEWSNYNEPEPPLRVWPRRDALLEVATVLAHGQPVEKCGPLVIYRGGPAWAPRRIEWAPKSPSPTVGYFPRQGSLGPITRAALRALLDAGLTPAQWGVQLGPDMYAVEQHGFAVGGESTHRWGSIDIDFIGLAMAEQHALIPGVLTAAGWSVMTDGPDNRGAWIAVPPGQEGVPGVVVQARAELLHRGLWEPVDHRMGFKVSAGKEEDQVLVEAAFADGRGLIDDCTFDESQVRRNHISDLLHRYQVALGSAGWTALDVGSSHAVFRAPQLE